MCYLIVIVVKDIYEVNSLVHKVESYNMDEEGNVVIDNNEENENEVEGRLCQRNIYYKVLENLSF